LRPPRHWRCQCCRLSAATARCAPPSAGVTVVTFGPTVLVTKLAANAALVFRWILYPVPLATFVQVSRTAVRPKRSGRTADAYGSGTET
jgi:hypothetical protein